MGGVYGEMLSAFPELMKQYKVFKMEPRIGAGYSRRYDERIVPGYWSQRRTGKIGIEGDLNVPDHKGILWAMGSILGKRIKIEENDFVEIDDEVYRVVQNDNFLHEGGFYKLYLQVMRGVTDQQVTDTKVEQNIREGY